MVTKNEISFTVGFRIEYAFGVRAICRNDSLTDSFGVVNRVNYFFKCGGGKQQQKKGTNACQNF